MISGMASGTSTRSSRCIRVYPRPSAASPDVRRDAVEARERVAHEDQQRVRDQPDLGGEQRQAGDRDEEREQREAGDRVQRAGRCHDRAHPARASARSAGSRITLSAKPTPTASDVSTTWSTSPSASCPPLRAGTPALSRPGGRRGDEVGGRRRQVRGLRRAGRVAHVGRDLVDGDDASEDSVTVDDDARLDVAVEEDRQGVLERGSPVEQGRGRLDELGGDTPSAGTWCWSTQPSGRPAVVEEQQVPERIGHGAFDAPPPRRRRPAPSPRCQLQVVDPRQGQALEPAVRADEPGDERRRRARQYSDGGPNCSTTPPARKTATRSPICDRLVDVVGHEQDRFRELLVAAGGTRSAAVPDDRVDGTEWPSISA